MSSLNEMSFLAMIALRDALLATKARLEREEQQRRDAIRLAEALGSDVIEPVDFDFNPLMRLDPREDL